MSILYATRADLESALSPTTVLTLFDDGNSGNVSQVALDGVLNRASRMVDSYLARVFKGPFPVTQTPVPSTITFAALEFAIAFSFERHPEYVHTYGETYRASTRFKRATEMMDRICQAQQEIPDWVLQPKQRNIGGIVIDDGPRTVVDNADGSTNLGDF